MKEKTPRGSLAAPSEMTKCQMEEKRRKGNHRRARSLRSLGPKSQGKKKPPPHQRSCRDVLTFAPKFSIPQTPQTPPTTTTQPSPAHHQSTTHHPTPASHHQPPRPRQCPTTARTRGTDPTWSAHRRRWGGDGDRRWPWSRSWPRSLGRWWPRSRRRRR